VPLVSGQQLIAPEGAGISGNVMRSRLSERASVCVDASAICFVEECRALQQLCEAIDDKPLKVLLKPT